MAPTKKKIYPTHSNNPNSINQINQPMTNLFKQINPERINTNDKQSITGNRL